MDAAFNEKLAKKYGVPGIMPRFIDGGIQMNLTKERLATMIDHTNLKAYADEAAIKNLCDEAREYNFGCVVVNPSQIKRCADYLRESSVHVGTVVGFPLGQATIACKVFETREAIQNGAGEADYVINISELKNGNLDYIQQEMLQIVSLCAEHNVISKVIFENCYLTDDEKIKAAEIAANVKPDFVKTSTGVGTGGATIEDVRLMKSVVGDSVKVKAAGGIRDIKTALAMIEAGAERIGTSSGIQIISGFENRERTRIETDL